MRVARRILLAAILGFVPVLATASCATFCEEPDPAATDLGPEVPPDPRWHVDAWGRRCLTVTAFDVLEGLGRPAPGP